LAFSKERNKQFAVHKQSFYKHVAAVTLIAFAPTQIKKKTKGVATFNSTVEMVQSIMDF